MGLRRIQVRRICARERSVSPRGEWSRYVCYRGGSYRSSKQQIKLQERRDGRVHVAVRSSQSFPSFRLGEAHR